MAARSAADIGKVLFSGPHARGQPWVACAAFRSVIDASPGEAVECALLLCTDRRWEDETVQFVRQILRGGLIPDADLDRLAEHFLWKDRLVIDYPVDWVGSASGSRPSRPSGRKLRAGQMLTAIRKIAPPLRRWAASHVLRRRPARLVSVEDRARTLRGPVAAAVAAGIVDAIESLPREEIDRVLEQSLAWPAANVRLAALEVMARRMGPGIALARAAGDSNARVRGWRPAEDRAAARSRGSRRTAGNADHKADAGSQMDLFRERG